MAVKPFEAANWYPVDLDTNSDMFRMVSVDPEAFPEPAFHDVRMDLDLATSTWVPTCDVPLLPASAVWIWHTSFCGSSLLSRMLQIPPELFALREPLILRRLSDRAHAGGDISKWIAPSLGLLSRPWAPWGMVVLKPTHAALNVAIQLMQVASNARMVLLTSDLEDFVVSYLKKSRETLRQIPILTERALSASAFASRLPAEALNPPSLLAAAGLQWAAQRELAIKLLATHRTLCMPLDSRSLLDDPVGAALRCADWLRLDIDRGILRAHADSVSRKHAKAPTRAYDSRMRASETTIVMNHYRAEIEAAMDWAGQWVLPYMQASSRNLAA